MVDGTSMESQPVRDFSNQKVTQFISIIPMELRRLLNILTIHQIMTTHPQEGI